MTELQALHDRATQGLPLSDKEQAQLAQWYAREDEAEARLLGVSAGIDNTDLLQTQIKAALAQVASVTQQIQQLVLQNEELRREVTVLKQNLAQRVTAPAL
jgi:glutamine synthetase adenylyltransferase